MMVFIDHEPPCLISPPFRPDDDVFGEDDDAFGPDDCAFGPDDDAGGLVVSIDRSVENA